VVIQRLQRAVAAVPGVIVYFRPVQDIQISTRLSRAQYQYTLTGTDPKEVDNWASRLAQKLRASALLQDVASRRRTMDFGCRSMWIAKLQDASAFPCRRSSTP